MRATFLSKHFRLRFIALPVLACGALGFSALTAGGCSSSPAGTTGTGATGGGGSGGASTSGTGATTSSGSTQSCSIAEKPFELGDPNGHADPLGAKKAGQARAGRIQKQEQIVQPAHGRQKIRIGDFLLANDKIAVAVEDKGLSDGYARFGGELLAIDGVGDDGKPLGLSYYIETLLGLSIEMVNPTSVAVLKDGSDGGEAVVRVVGVTEPIPFMEGPIGALFPDRYGIEMALDYVLKPGWEKVLLRMSVVNRGAEAIDFGANKPTKDELFGFFHYSRSQLFTAETGFADPKGQSDWVGFDSGPSGFAFRAPDGKLEYGTTQSGFSLFWGPGFVADPCTMVTHDHAEIYFGRGGSDGVAEAVRRGTGAPNWREIKGVVKDGAGVPVEGALVLEQADDTKAFLSRARTGAGGTFVLHAPEGKSVTLVPQKQGYPQSKGGYLDGNATDAVLSFDAHAKLHVKAVEQGSNEPLPVRVQVIPKVPLAPTPEAFGVLDETDGRLYQEFVMNGDTTLIVPPGDHHVVVSRGYEWELYETDVKVAAGETAEVAASLLHSVDSTGRMCADFHIHSFYSADSDDPVEHKVKGALADGLDLPVSSEHEWIVDFQPIVEQLGMQKWAHGISSEELTTFSWGHYGVVPLDPKDDKLNRGAVEWIGKVPGEFFKTVHEQTEDPALIINHPRSAGFAGYFSAAQYDKDSGTAKKPELWSENFDAIEVWNSSDFEKNRTGSVADWFSLLNHGHKFWAVGSSDSHHLRTSPVGYPRTCLFFGHDDPTKITGSAVRDAIKNGDSTISGGLYMTVDGPKGEHPGQTIKVDASGEALITVTVQSPGWILPNKLETIVNGVTIATDDLLPMGNGPAHKFVNQVKVKLDPAAAANWVVFHARGDGDLAPLHPGKNPFAASNPFFLQK